MVLDSFQSWNNCFYNKIKLQNAKNPFRICEKFVWKCRKIFHVFCALRKHWQVILQKNFSRVHLAVLTFIQLCFFLLPNFLFIFWSCFCLAIHKWSRLYRVWCVYLQLIQNNFLHNCAKRHSTFNWIKNFKCKIFRLFVWSKFRFKNQNFSCIMFVFVFCQIHLNLIFVYLSNFVCIFALYEVFKNLLYKHNG